MTASWTTSVLLSMVISIGTGAALPASDSWLSAPGADSVPALPTPRTVAEGPPAPTTTGGIGAAAQRPAATPAGAWLWPLAPPYAVVHRFDPPAQRWGSGHRGVDLGTPTGAVVVAPADGVVTFAGVLVDRGVLVVGHSGGLRSTFEPVSALVEVGAVIHRGQPIATLDVAGVGVGHCAPLSCLHWGVIRAETYLDPLWFVAGRVVLLPMA
ncbi:MAG: peptidoglycan DD-metalloendopeptidase family protein [Dermatophilaceae bacterium]